MSGLHQAFAEIVADVPVYGDLDRALEQAGRERRRRAGLITGLAAAAAVVAVIVGVLATDRSDRAAPDPALPTPTPSVTEKAVESVPRKPSEVLAATQMGRDRLEVAGHVVPGRWFLERNRRDVWVAGHSDAVGYMSPALWWGKGTTTHEVPGQRGGFAISQDARWIVWTRAASGEYQDFTGPRVMEVVDTATGEVRWSRDADADAPEIAALMVTNDGVVVFAHCLKPVLDRGGWPQCDDARIDTWAPRSGRTETVPAEVIVEHGPPGTVAVLTPLVQVDGMPHNGLLVRDTPAGRPHYVRVSARGDVEVLATLPRSTVAVTADERFALLSAGCAGQADTVCRWSVLPLEGGEPRPLHTPARFAGFRTDIDWPAYPYVIEHGDLLLMRDLGDYAQPLHAVARCSLSQARCVRIRD